MGEKPENINSIQKAFIVLDCFLDNNDPLSLKELTERTGWPKSTVHSLLSAMRKQDIITQDDGNGKYSMGIHVFQLGSAIVRSLDIVNIAKPLMKEVSELVNRSVHLTLLRYPHAVLIARVEPVRSRLKTIVTLGATMPLYCNAHGKVFLAYMSDCAVEEYLRTTQLIQHTSRTITDPHALQEQIKQIRIQHYAVEEDERHFGMRGIAAPILNSQGKAIYSFGVVGMFNEMKPSEFQSAITIVKKAASDISYRLGYKDI